MDDIHFGQAPPRREDDRLLSGKTARATSPFHWRHGEAGRVEQALAASHQVTRLRSRISRVSAIPLEPRAAFAYVQDDGRTALRASHQSPHLLRNEIASGFGLARDEVRVLAGDVGGSFGMKSGALREEMAVYWAARRLGRGVRWTASRSESFLCDDQARDVDMKRCATPTSARCAASRSADSR